ncbi:hypothetical protein KPSA3_04222 [Pseudomonas syringae pv. actinidiae]|uniref:Uncharacterized protein n=1 Tax=Pseudomonas syringae pv. actinidiae TaxID=103796 RepID=A0AAN4TMJ6_PSESF|nr:hypothetical protein KPSA3_04222 [Pseudomonas syringae pv. actinidiae]
MNSIAVRPGLFSARLHGGCALINGVAVRSSRPGWQSWQTGPSRSSPPPNISRSSLKHCMKSMPCCVTCRTRHAPLFCSRSCQVALTAKSPNRLAPANAW